MTTQTTQEPEQPALTGGGGGVRAERLFSLWTLATGLLVLAILALILITTTNEAWPVLRAGGFRFITERTWDPNPQTGDAVFGALSFMYGTAVSSLIALLIAVPISVGIALFLTELAPRRLGAPAVTIIDLLASVPSVVFGLWGVLVVAPALVHVYRWLNDVLGGIPLLGDVFGVPVGTGRSFMTAGVILAIMITPIITSISREVLSTVPQANKDAAYAVGATHWEMITGAVFPHSFAGLIGAVMLGLGRALGETIAVALVIGSSPQITKNLFGSGDSMPAVIANQWGDADSLQKSALIGLAVTLFAITILVNMIANAVVQRSARRSQGLR